MNIAIGNDHTALGLKRAVIELLDELGHQYEDHGTNSTESCDYPVSGEAAARAVVSGRCQLGIVICGTGVGIGIAANKVHGARCAMVSEAYSAQMAREHNNANMLAIGARVLAPEAAQLVVRAFLTAEFLGGRHQRRIDQVAEIERREAGR